MVTLEGLVIVNTGSFYTIKSGEHTYTGKLRGSFKQKEIRTTNPIAVGDWVRFELDEVGKAEEQPSGQRDDDVVWITELLPRRNYIIRRASNLSKQASIIAANLDRVLLIVTVNYPVTSTTFIDRFLATAEAYDVEVSLLFNKIDRYNNKDLEELEILKQLYGKIGYRCFEVSSLTGHGLDSVKEYIGAGVTLLSGHSGVGKSTFINTLIPGIDLRTAEISEAHNTGTHTTTYSEMIPLPWSKDSYVIDTPGIKGFGTIEFEREEVGHYFPEIFEVSKDCRFNNCTHRHEPGCAVQQALKKGIIAPSRFKSYLSILNEDQDEKYRLGY